MSLTKDEVPLVILIGQLLDSISEVLSLVESIETEHEIFMEVGCYLHRASPIIMELQTESTTKNLIGILYSLTTNVDSAKQLIKIFSTNAKAVMSTDLKSIIEQLESTLNSIGSDLSSIPSSAIKNNYTELVIQSVSRDMRNVHLQIDKAQHYKVNEPNQYNIFTEVIKEGEGKRIEAPVRRKYQRTLSSYSSDTPRLADFLKGVYYGSQLDEIQLLAIQAGLAEYIDPLYDTFFCPLTKKIMEDPVTLESGVTYERSAINEWFEKLKHEEELVCPTTQMKLRSRTLSTNLALKTTIKEWAERNEATRLRGAHTALSLALSEAMVLDAVRDLQVLCRKGYKKEYMHNVGITELLANFLAHRDKKVRSETLGLLQLLAEDDKGKEIIVKTGAIAESVKMLSSYSSSERQASVSFLLELSKSKAPCENIGAATGCIFMLITMKNKSDDPLVSEEAGATLKNLEKCPKNIKCMAENGFLQPLLNNLIDGSEETQAEMATYLNDLVLRLDIQTHTTEKLSKDLIQIANGSNNLIRKAALKALVLISSFETNSKTLIEAGIIQVTTEKMFTSMDSKEDLAAILGNVLHSGINPELIQVNKHGHTMTSEFFICNIISMIQFSMPYELNMNLFKVLAYLSNIPKIFSRVVSVIKETKAIQTVIPFLNSQHDELAIAATELLIKLSSNIGHAIAEELCKTQGQPESLIGIFDISRIQINKKHAMYLNLLAKLPHQNLALNLTLLHDGAVPIMLERISIIQRGEALSSSWTRCYLEGLVGTLVRFTSTLYMIDILHMAMQQNVTSVLTGLIQSNAGSEEVQRLAALGLEKLSAESINLTIKHPEMTKSMRGIKFFFKCFSMKQKPSGDARVKLQVCPVHKGDCSSSDTFCLLEAKAVQGLVSCLESGSRGVVEAALGAISTLLDDRVDLEGSVRKLSEVDAVQKIMGVLREHQEGSIWEKTLWVIERFLVWGGERSVNDISKERILPRALVSAFHHEDGRTREVAERIMRKLNQIQASS